MFRTSNPALTRGEAGRYFNDGPAQSWDDLESRGGYEGGAPAAPADKSVMTMQSTVNKCAFLIALCAASAMGGWMLFLERPGLLMPIWLVACFGGLGLVLLASFKPQTSPFVAPVYAILQGVFVGGVSALFARATADSDGGMNTLLILNAVLVTFGIFGGLLAAYSMKLIRPNRMFYNVVTTATMGAALYALLAIGFSFFGSTSLISVYDINNGGLISLGFSALLIVIASANLVLDFDMISHGVRNRAPKYMEWFAGLGLLVTLVWLYIEVLRMLAKLRGGD